MLKTILDPIAASLLVLGSQLSICDDFEQGSNDFGFWILNFGLKKTTLPFSMKGRALSVAILREATRTALRPQGHLAQGF